MTPPPSRATYCRTCGDAPHETRNLVVDGGQQATHRGSFCFGCPACSERSADGLGTVR